LERQYLASTWYVWIYKIYALIQIRTRPEIKPLHPLRDMVPFVEIKGLHLEGPMAVIYSPFLREIINTHNLLAQNTSYPFFDPACRLYEAIRAAFVDRKPLSTIFETFGITEYQYRQALAAFRKGGVANLIGLAFPKLTEPLDIEAERMIYVLKKARPWVPATKMVLILQGFGFEMQLSLMRHLYASYGWAQGTKDYRDIDFLALNLKVTKLSQLQTQRLSRDSFFQNKDRLQTLLEVFRTLGSRGIAHRYPGSRVSLQKHKNAFQLLGLIGLVDKARPAFRNSKLGFKEEGWMIFSKIQHPKRSEIDYQKILRKKQIHVDLTCIKKIFDRWHVMHFQSKFKGDLQRFSRSDELQGESDILPDLPPITPSVAALRLDIGFVNFLKTLSADPVALANPGLFLFLPLLHRLKIFQVASSVLDTDPDKGYSWFSLLVLNLSRIIGGISSVSKACRTSELSLPLSAGLVQMPCKDTILNGIAVISEKQLLLLRRFLTKAAYDQQLVRGRSIALDFHMRDFTGNDVELKNIGKGPSPKRKICFPGFRPHLAWDVGTGAPLSLEFRSGTARGTTTFKRFIRELLPETLADQNVEHIYLDSEYTGQKIWQFIVDSQDGLGADLTMCIKQNRAVKKHINSFLDTNFEWLFYDEGHSYSSSIFSIPIQKTSKELRCVLKRHEHTGRLRCFGSTLPDLDARGVLTEYERRWVIENGIKDLVGNYFFDNIPGIDPHRINIHYFIVTLARLLYQMFCSLYPASKNQDETQKWIGTIRHEFLVGSNATIARENEQLILTWQDPFTEKDHKNLSALFDSLNKTADKSLPFLGGLMLKFELMPPRSRNFRNLQRRVNLDFG